MRRNWMIAMSLAGPAAARSASRLPATLRRASATAAARSSAPARSTARRSFPPIVTVIGLTRRPSARAARISSTARSSCPARNVPVVAPGTARFASSTGAACAIRARIIAG